MDPSLNGSRNRGTQWLTQFLWGTGWHLFWMCGQRMSQRWPQVEAVSWKRKGDSLGRGAAWEEPQAEVNTLASLYNPRLFMAALDWSFNLLCQAEWIHLPDHRRSAVELWFSPCVWSICFSSIADGHNTPVAQVRQSAVYWLLVQHYYMPGLCRGIFLFSWGQCRRNVCANKLPLKCKFRIFKHYWVHDILLLWASNSF